MGTGGSEMGFVAPCPRPMHWRLCGYDWRLARHNSCAHYTANQTKTHTQTNNMDSHQKWIKYFSFDSNNIWTNTVEQVRPSSSSSSSWSKPCWQVVASARTHKNILNYSYRYFITAPCFNDLFVLTKYAIGLDSTSYFRATHRFRSEYDFLREILITIIYGLAFLITIDRIKRWCCVTSVAVPSAVHCCD